MSNLWLNIRFGYYHLQIGDPNWYNIKITFNKYLKNNLHMYKKLGWFQINKT